MQLETDVPNILNALGATFVAALGVWIALHKPRTRASVALAAFMIGFGTFVIPTYALADLSRGEEPAHDAFRALTQTLAAVSLLALLRVFPRPLTRVDRPAVAVAWLVFAVGAVANLASRLIESGGWQRAAYVQDNFSYLAIDVAEYAANEVLFAALPTAAVLLTLRYARLTDPSARTQAALMAGAFLLYVGFIAGAGGSESHDPIHNPLDLLSNARFALACLVAGTTWLRATTTSDKPARARNLALLSFGMPLVGLVYAATGKGLGGYGITRTAFVLFLAYAILRAQLLGLDVKIRFAISKSTVAAVFIAVFFVATEGAQLLFGASNQWVGLAAAGALVFAMAPLQRAAERLAEKAVPLATPTSPVETHASAAGDIGQEVVYRNALRLALRDRRLTRAEEAHLHELAEALRIRPRRAHEMLAEVEREGGAGMGRGGVS